MQRAAAVLGAQPPILLGYPDMGLDALPPGTLREKFIRVIRQLRPDVVFAEDPYAPFEPHPDHRAVAWAATEAITYARLPLVHPEHLAEGLLPHLVPEKYFYADHLSLANKIVDISDTMDRKIAALAEHRSQVEFLVEGELMEARSAGLDVRTMFGAAADDPAALLAWGVQTMAAEIGQRIGVKYGEAFRYERFGSLVEGMLAGRQPVP
jgi:LmbE family N-acetylglucosaminyl deacetylase